MAFLSRRGLVIGSAFVAASRETAAKSRLLSARAPASTYVGLGDLSLSSVTMYHGLRAYSRAVALAGGNIVRVKRVTDSATQVITALANGDLDQAAADTFRGIDATGAGAITGTALTFTGGHLGDQVTGTGVTAGTIIVGGSSPNWTVNLSQTVASTTLTLYVGLKVDLLYEQVSGTANIAPGATSPYLMLYAENSGTLPIMGSSAGWKLTVALAAISAPVMMATVWKGTADDAVPLCHLGSTSSWNGHYFVYNTGGTVSVTTAQASSFGTATSAGTLTANTLGSIGGRFTSSTSRKVYLNGTASTANTTNLTPTLQNTFQWGQPSTSGASNSFTGKMFESIYGTADWSDANFAAISTNEHSYLGF